MCVPILVKYSLDRAVEIGRARQASHVENSTKRIREDDASENIDGVAGELAFNSLTRLPMNDHVEGGGGDGGVDFTFICAGRPLTIDVKTARNPRYLLMRADKAHQAADIFVLSGIFADNICFFGWEHKSVMLLMPKDKFGFEQDRHYRAIVGLRPMSQLLDLMGVKHE